MAEAPEASKEGDAEFVKTVGLVRVIIRSEVNSFPLPRNGVLQVIELAEALETSSEGDAEVVKNVGLVRVAVRSEINSYPCLEMASSRSLSWPRHSKRVKKELPRLLR